MTCHLHFQILFWMRDLNVYNYSLWRDFIIIQMSHDILQEEGRKLKKDLEETAEKDKVEEEDVDCVDTKIQVWDGDEYDEFQSDFLNQIFPYKINKKTMTQGSSFIFHFLSSSLYYWIELVQEGEPEAEKLGKKDVKVIEQILKTDESDNWIAFRRWGEYFQKKQEFHAHQQKQESFIVPQGEDIYSYSRGNDEFAIKKYLGSNKQFTEYKKRMQVLLLFYIDGVSFVIEQSQNWIYYVVYKKTKGKKLNFVGMLSKYVFKLSTVKERHRVSQVFIMPCYQKAGHGKELIDVVYDISLSDPKCFEITTQIPSFQYQCLRDYKQIELLIKNQLADVSQLKKMINNKDIDQNRGILLSKENVRKIKEVLKIPGHQIERLINILIYFMIQKQNDDMVKAHFEQNMRQKIIFNRSPFKTRRKLPHITFYGQVTNLKDFMLQKAKEDILRNQEQVQQILTETINGFNRVISKLVKLNLL